MALRKTVLRRDLPNFFFLFPLILVVEFPYLDFFLSPRALILFNRTADGIVN